MQMLSFSLSYLSVLSFLIIHAGGWHVYVEFNSTQFLLLTSTSHVTPHQMGGTSLNLEYMKS
jgi:hypothetical protein